MDINSTITETYSPRLSFIEKYGYVKYTNASRLRTRYPISGECEISGCTNPATVYEHDHETNLIRGLTCQSCNRKLGIIESKFPYYKNTPLVIHLKQYLEYHAAKNREGTGNDQSQA